MSLAVQAPAFSDASVWHGADRSFRLAAAFLRYFSLLADRSIGLCETVRYVVHVGGENISELPCSLETDVSRASGIKALMKRSYWLLVVFSLFGCAKFWRYERSRRSSSVSRVFFAP